MDVQNYNTLYSGTKRLGEWIMNILVLFDS